MEIKELTSDEFKNFTENYNLKSIYQTSEYGFVMQKQKFESIFLGLFDNNNIVGASLILIQKRKGFKYAYAPRGFLIDYNDYNLLDTWTKLLKKYLSKKGITAIKVSPLIIKSVYDKKYDVISQNSYFDNIFNNLKQLGYYHFGYNNFFEALKPRFEALINIDLPSYMLFNNINKEYRTKIRSASKNCIKVYKGNIDDLKYLYLHTSKKYPRDLEYFKDCFKYYKKNIDFFYTKLDTDKYLKYVTKLYHDQEAICYKYNKLLNKDDNNKIISSKMEADKKLEKYKKDLVKATNYLKNYPGGIITSSCLLAKNNEEVYMLIDGYDTKYKNLNSKHLLIWKLIEKYSSLGYKKLNLGGIISPYIEDDKYKGLNDFKLGFGSKAIEYLGDLELICNSPLYFMYRNSAQISNILKK